MGGGDLMSVKYTKLDCKDVALTDGIRHSDTAGFT